MLIEEPAYTMNMLKDLVRGHQATLLMALILLFLCDFNVAEEEKQFLFDGSGYFKLSQTRSSTNGFSLKAKCANYDLTILEILPDSKGEDRSARFTKVIKFLDQKELPFKNPSAVLAELKACQKIFEDPESPTNDELKNDLDQQERKDTGSAAEIEAIRQELEETKQAAARDKDQLAELKRQLEEERQSAVRAREELDAKLASVVNGAAKEAELESRLKKETDARQHEIESVKAAAKSEMDKQIAQLKSNHEVEMKKLEATTKLAQMREKGLKQSADAASLEARKLKASLGVYEARDNKFREEVLALKDKCAQGERLISDRVQQAEDRKLRVADVEAIAANSVTGLTTVRFQMTTNIKNLMNDVQKALRAKRTKLHIDIANEIYNCAGFNACQGGVCCRNCWTFDVTPGYQARYA